MTNRKEIPASELPPARLIAELVDAARAVAYWENFGRRGDGNLEEATKNLQQKRRKVIKEITSLRTAVRTQT